MGKFGKNYKQKKFKPRLTPEESIMKINSHYGVTIALDDDEIDITNPKRGPGYYLATDISRPEFPYCSKLSLTILEDQQKDLMPKMPELRTLALVQNNIKNLYLKRAFFGNLSTLILENNKIATVENLDCLKYLRSLTEVRLYGNPIASNMDEKKKLTDEYPYISFIFTK